jgi:hypothetical protein
VLCNSLVLSAVVFYPLRLSGDFTLFWLVFLTTSSIGIGARRAGRRVARAPARPPFSLSPRARRAPAAGRLTGAGAARSARVRHRGRVADHGHRQRGAARLRDVAALLRRPAAARAGPAGVLEVVRARRRPRRPARLLPRKQDLAIGLHALSLTRRRRPRRYGYLDFLRYAWGAQMCNQFEGQTTVVLDQQTVRPRGARSRAPPPGRAGARRCDGPGRRACFQAVAGAVRDARGRAPRRRSSSTAWTRRTSGRSWATRPPSSCCSSCWPGARRGPPRSLVGRLPYALQSVKAGWCWQACARHALIRAADAQAGAGLQEGAEPVRGGRGAVFVRCGGPGCAGLDVRKARPAADG